MQSFRMNERSKNWLSPNSQAFEALNYEGENECCLTSNHLFFGRKLSLFDPETADHLSD